MIQVKAFVMIQVKALGKARWKEYRKLRLDSLKHEPLAFGSSYIEEKRLSEEEWKSRMRDTLFAISEDKIIGMIVYKFEKKIKSSHIAHIHGYYVLKQARSKGAGTMLLEIALQKIAENKRIRKVRLSVNPEQKAAVRLYEKSGFRKACRLKEEMQIDGRFYDDLIMERIIQRQC